MAMTRQDRINSHIKQNQIKSVKESFKNDLTVPVKPIAQLKDSTGGVVSNVLDLSKIGDLTPISSGSGAVFGYTEANADKVHVGIDGLVDDVASLASKVNEIILALKSLGIIK
tara:strand:- start:273 stop:611 length:339 start_codon:yes stop_codon:yes gene_type:complete